MDTGDELTTELTVQQDDDEEPVRVVIPASEICAMRFDADHPEGVPVPVEEIAGNSKFVVFSPVEGKDRTFRMNGISPPTRRQPERMRRSSPRARGAGRPAARRALTVRGDGGDSDSDPPPDPDSDAAERVAA